MKRASLPLPELAMIAGTRAILGVGVGLLLADMFSDATRKKLGWSLFFIGALSTIPLGLDVFKRIQQGNHRAAEP
jgi:hypothetical protein